MARWRRRARAVTGEVLRGPCGTATHVSLSRLPRPDYEATLSMWFLDCPGQSPAWRHYGLGMIHLRPIVRVRPAEVRVPGATHELLLVAYDPAVDPKPTDPETWRHLTPVNVCEQLELPDDDAARTLARMAALSVVQGSLPAEPPFSGQREPWRTALIKTAAHFRGEEHAP